MTQRHSEKDYDIFISYRRDDGAQYARILQLELEKRGYCVFLDYEELVDDVFGKHIQQAIQNAPYFIIVLTPKYLERSMEDNSWVKKEIQLALDHGSHFIPVNPDKLFNGIPKDTPAEIQKIVESIQHSEINFGQLLKDSVNKMVRDRLAPPKSHSASKWYWIGGVAATLLIAAGLWFAWGLREKAVVDEKATICEQLDKDSGKKPFNDWMNWSPDIRIRTLRVIHQILDNMETVSGADFIMGAVPGADGLYDENVDVVMETPSRSISIDPFWIGKYEVSVEEWNTVMGGKYAKEDANLPIRSISFQECQEFCQKLCDLTGLPFRLPSEEEWEFAAKGGAQGKKAYRYIGGDNPDEVSWYNKNSKDVPHVRNDKRGGLHCNALNLYDMGGNVYEWCDSPFMEYRDIISQTEEPLIIDPDAKVIRGGSYASASSDITATHRQPLNANDKLETVGFRLAIGPHRHK